MTPRRSGGAAHRCSPMTQPARRASKRRGRGALDLGLQEQTGRIVDEDRTLHARRPALNTSSASEPLIADDSSIARASARITTH